MFLGVSNFFRKLTSRSLGPLDGFLAESFAFSLLTILLIILTRKPSVVKAGILLKYPYFSALAVFIAVLLLFRAYEHGNLALASTAYSLGALVTATILSVVVLRESLSFINLIGLLMAVCAIFFLSYKK